MDVDDRDGLDCDEAQEQDGGDNEYQSKTILKH
jgi:hypothetical protein